jgi:beta-xylosidase
MPFRAVDIRRERFAFLPWEEIAPPFETMQEENEKWVKIVFVKKANKHLTEYSLIWYDSLCCESVSIIK